MIKKLILFLFILLSSVVGCSRNIEIDTSTTEIFYEDASGEKVKSLIPRSEYSDEIYEEPTRELEIIHEYSDMYTVCVVNFREEPNLESNIHCVVEKGAKILAEDFSWDNEWTHVVVNGTMGYIHTDLLSEAYVGK